ncbi:MAG: pyrimidine reductase family protein [Acidimicrobiales bacterium]
MIRAILPELAASLEDIELEAHYALAPGESLLRANFAVTADGAVEVGGVSAALSSPADHTVFVTLRALADVVLVGSGTVVAERYGPTRLSAQPVERRVARGQKPFPPIAVVTGSADLDVQLRLFTEHRQADPLPLIITAAAAPAENRAALASVAEVLICGEEHVDLSLAIATLRERGLTNVLCEGGPTLLGGLLGAGLVDEICLTHAPLLAGPDHLRLVAGAKLPKAAGLRLLGLLQGDGELMARYQVLPAAG